MTNQTPNSKAASRASGECRHSGSVIRAFALFAATLLILAVMISVISCAPRRSTVAKRKTTVDYAAVRQACEPMLDRINGHVAALAALGPRQTGQQGCDRALDYVRRTVGEINPRLAIGDLSTTVTVPLDRRSTADIERADGHSHVVLLAEDQGGGASAGVILPAYSFMPNSAQDCLTHPADQCPLGGCVNCEQPRPLIDLRGGSWDDFAGKTLAGSVVLLDFNSGDAWLRAASMGAYGAIIAEARAEQPVGIAPPTTVFQADAKYLATVPLHYPRLYVNQAEVRALRRSLAEAKAPRVQVASRLAWQNVPARGLELTIPGKDRSYSFVLAAHVDARCIVPDLAYGGSELYGLAEMLELVRYFTDTPPACDLKILFVSGHWQRMQLMRDYLAPDGPELGRVGPYYRLAMAMDLVPSGGDGRGLNLLTESAWEVNSYRQYNWLRTNLFGRDGWRAMMRAGGLGAGEDYFGGKRPTMSTTAGDDVAADRSNRSPLVYAPRYPTAEEPWQTLGMPTFAFQTTRLSRLAHNTPADTLEQAICEAGGSGAGVKDRLRPQLQLALGTIEHLLEYPQSLLPKSPPHQRKGRGYGGYARISGRILEWDKSTGWFAQRLPVSEPSSSSRPLSRTFVQALPTDRVINRLVSPLADKRVRTFRPWPIGPDRGQHRDLQSFMFQDIRLLETADFRLNTIYAATPETQYVVVGYTLDPAGRVCRATDFGIHGDGNPAYQCTELPLDSWDISLPVSLFECGSLALFDLIDFQRYNPDQETIGAWLPASTEKIGYAERGVAPWLRIQGVREMRSHTEIDKWSFTQYGPTAMIFLPGSNREADAGRPGAAGESAPPAAEVLLGGRFTNFAVLNNPGRDGVPRGLAVRSGESIRLADGVRPTPAECVRELAVLDSNRIEQFASHDVASPLAGRYRLQSQAAIAAADAARAAGDLQTARAHDLRSWVLESETYHGTLSLMVDVVSTTVLYFVLLIPFSFLIERLMFPQRTTLRTVLAASLVFMLFASLLYLFHPGFKLAHNIVVITISFVIVVMSVPALILLLVRGVAMLRAIGSKAVITQRSEAESAGVVVASLSLAVSNMRRRKLRTTLTLSTITVLVMALVLLTTSSAFDIIILEPSGVASPSFQGLQVFNTADRRKTLIPEMVEAYERILSRPDKAGAHPPLVVRREFIHYGYDHTSANACLQLTAGGGTKRVTLPYIQIMDERDDGIAYSPPLNLAACPRFSANRPDYAGGPIHLSDLMEGRFLRAGDVDVCLLPSTMADELGVKVGDEVRVMGLPLRVVGIWTSQLVDERKAFMSGPLDNLRDLDGQPLTALQSGAWRQGQPDSPLHASSMQIIIVPRAWNEQHRIFIPCIQSLAIVPQDEPAPPRTPGETADATPSGAQQLASEIRNVDVFSHFRDPRTGAGVSQRLSMRTATQIKGSSMMLIVLVVAVLMILAIMTGTVYERMKEIHILSSVGLSPRHVAGMFFVEALVYAGIASVLGYFLGVIALSILLKYLKSTGQQAEFYPNYLGVFVLYSIGVAVAATLLSSVYPIRLASRIVNPSAGKGWGFDEAGGGDEADILLPFIATTWTEARGMMAYAHDFLAIHQGERSGRFVCESPPRGTSADQSLDMETPIWLAPFERNISQRTLLQARRTADGAWWELRLKLRRLSGQDYLWRRGATLFVNVLSKHLLRWRGMTAEQEAQTAARADAIFTSASTTEGDAQDAV